MKNLVLTVALLSIVITTSCSVEPAEVNYGKEGCHFCTMTIVDHQHAAQIVTKKGKAYKFDAIECMLNDLKQRDENDLAMILVIDYNNPGQFIDAHTATFLISENIPSPMGAFLSAGQDAARMNAIKEQKGGVIYNWSGIKDKFDVD